MHRVAYGAAALVFLGSCAAPDSLSAGRAAAAEGFFHGVFACDPGAIDRYAAADVAVSYPVFETLFQTPVIRGREAVKEFSAGFCTRWEDPRVAVHQAVVEGDRVVLVWEFSALPVAGSSDSGAGAVSRASWGGISFFRLDRAGQVIEEVGEESTPGPAARLWGS